MFEQFCNTRFVGMLAVGEPLVPDCFHLPTEDLSPRAQKSSQPPKSLAVGWYTLSIYARIHTLRASNAERENTLM